jgi:hypothetical protein
VARSGLARRWANTPANDKVKQSDLANPLCYSVSELCLTRPKLGATVACLLLAFALILALVWIRLVLPAIRRAPN